MKGGSVSSEVHGSLIPEKQQGFITKKDGWV